MEYENFVTDRKEYESIKEHRHYECRGHVILDFDVDAVLCVCDLIVIVEGPREH